MDYFFLSSVIILYLSLPKKFIKKNFNIINDLPDNVKMKSTPPPFVHNLKKKNALRSFICLLCKIVLFIWNVANQKPMLSNCYQLMKC